MPWQFRLFIPCLAVIVLVGMGSSHACPQTKPVVVSTDPPNGATNISRSLTWITFTFSKPMQPMCGGSSSFWPGGLDPTNCVWSEDKMTVRMTRGDPVTLIPVNATVRINLNPAPYQWYKDTEGNALDPYTLLFTVVGGTLEKVAADPQKGFSWPYYLYTPSAVKNPPVLMVEPNNTGTTNDNPAFHDAAAQQLIMFQRTRAEDLGVPYLVPTFPRPKGDVGYTHALDRKTIESAIPGLVRIDLQLAAMIRDAQARLAVKGIAVDKKALFSGFSASGSFVSRFVMLHPDLVKAASVGAPGFGPIVPVGQWNGQALPYPEGVADLQQLVGKSFDVDTFRSVPLQVWIGDMDIGFDPSWVPTNPTAARIMAAFGGTYAYQRWPVYEAAYYSAGSLCQFVVFPGMKHQWPDWNYMLEFFERNRTSPQPPLPKPMFYKSYFPHIASFGPWETEIALVNTIPGGTAVQGQLQAFRAGGGDPIESVPIVLPPGSRKEITVGNFFQNPKDIAYLAFTSDSGFLAGYTRFYQPGNCASLIIRSGDNNGWFTKVENDGWTGIAFVNADTTTASIELTAWDDDGNRVAATTLTLAPGNKYVGMVNQLFDADVTRARYVKYASDKKLVGFTVSGSADGQMLDGLHSLGQYILPWE